MLCFRENETDWNVDLNGSYIIGRKDDTMKEDQARMIHLHAFNHFYDLYSGFLRYTCGIENRDKITVKVSEKDGFPDTIDYTFSCPEENSEMTLNYTEKGDTKVIVDWGEKYTLEHSGDKIQVRKENQYGSKEFTLSGNYTLQQAVMMLRTQSYLWWHDFGQERISDRLMYPQNTNPVTLKFIYNQTGDSIERIVQQVEVKDNVTEGKLRTGKPSWLQSDETPRDPDGQKMEFVAQLDHSNMFGTLFLFYSEQHQLVSQVFQCT